MTLGFECSSQNCEGVFTSFDKALAHLYQPRRDLNNNLELVVSYLNEENGNGKHFFLGKMSSNSINAYNTKIILFLKENDSITFA